MNDADPVDLHPTCTATARSGNRCGRMPVPGATVCDKHGGKAPQVQRKARLRLAELIDPAIATLAREMVQADKSNDKQRAANSILDRAGVPRMTRELSSEDSRIVLLERLRSLRESAEPAPESDADQTNEADLPDDSPDTDLPTNQIEGEHE